MAIAASLAGCRVLSIEQAAAIRHRQGSEYDAKAEVARLWQPRAVPQLARTAVTLAQLRSARADAGRQFGRQAGEGSPWTVVLRGVGIVEAVDAGDPKGRIRITDASGETLALQIGPVVSGSAIRDSLPFVRFDDVPDQTAFAELGAALTERALAPLRPTIRTLRPGDRVRYVGVGPLDTALTLTPVSLERAS